MNFMMRMDRLFLISMLTTALIISLILGITTVSNRYNKFKEKSERLRVEYISNQKAMIQNEVEKVFILIESLKQSNQKKSYIQYFDPLNRVIGTGEYIDDLDSYAKELVFESISKIRYGKDGYFFMVKFDGIVLMHGVSRDLVGKNIIDEAGDNGVKMSQVLKNTIKNPEGVFGSYTWKKPVSLEMVSKLVFCKVIPEWNCIIGTGVYIDDIEKALLAEKIKLEESVKKELLQYLLILSIALILIFIIAHFISNSIKTSLQSFYDYFEEAESGLVKIDTRDIKFIEFEKIAITANKVIEKGRQAQFLLKQNEEKFRTIFDTSPYVITLNNAKDGKFIEVNDAFLRETGYSQEEVVGKSPLDLKLWENPQERKEFVSQLKKTGSVQDHEYSFIKKNGETGIGLISSHLLSINNQEAYIAITHDITEIKQVEAKLKQSEEIFRDFFHKLPDPTLVIARDGRLIDANDAAIKTFGYSKEELLNLNVDALKVPTGNKKDHFTDGKIYESFARRKDGTILEVEVHNHRTMVKGENVVVSTARDIRDRKKVEEDRTKLLSAIEQAKEAIVITDLEGNIEYVNPAFEQISGYKKEDSIGQKSNILKSGVQKDSLYTTMWENISSGKNWKGRLVNKKKDGSLFTEELSISPIFDNNNKITNFVAVKSDISNEIKMEEQIQKAQKLEAIGTLSGGIAHDFNNILSPIVGYSEILLNGIPEDSPFKKGLEEIRKGSIRAKKLVKQILTFSRQEEGSYRATKIQGVILEALELIRATIPSSISIKHEIQKDCGAVFADSTQIHQIIMNLSTNAFHAMEAMGGELRVRLNEVSIDSGDLIVSGIEPGEYACLAIRDNGIGIDKKTLDRIFDPFFTTKKNEKGTGMGLSVVHGIVKKMKGEIQVYSELGIGSEFKIYLPLLKESVEKPYIQTSNVFQGGDERLLLVDDEEDILQMQKDMLVRLGYKVTINTSSIEALEIFKKNPESFDMVITDMTMPDISGEKLSVELLKICPDLPVIMNTGNNILSSELIEKVGIQGLLIKPVRMKELSSMIRDIFDNKKV